MAENKIEIRVTAKNDTKPGLSSSKADVKAFSEDFDRLVTKSLKDGENAFAATTKKAVDLRAELTQMRADFAQTGDKGLLGGIKQSESDLKLLENAVKEMTPVISDFDRLITRSLQDGQTAFESTTRRAEDLRVELARMRDDLAKTGSEGLFGDIKKSEQDLKILEDAVREMAPRVEAEFASMGDKAGRTGGRHAGDEFVKGFPLGLGSAGMGLAKGLVSLIDKLAPAVAEDAALIGEKAGKAVADGVVSGADAAAQDIPQLFTPEGAIGAAIVAGAVGTLAPLAASAIGAALTFGVGAAVLGIGAVIEQGTPRIADALGQLQTRAAAEMRDAAWPLVEPFHAALEQIDTWLHDEGKDFSGIFTAAAPGVKGLTTDILGMVTAILPGLRDLTQMFGEFAADPQVQSSFEQIGRAVGTLFSTIGSNKQTIVDTFEALVIVLDVATGLFDGLIWAARGFDDAIHAVATPIEWLGQKLGVIGDTGGRTLTAVKDSTEMLVPVTHAAAQSYDDLAASLSKTAATADTVAGALVDKILGGLMNGDRATLHWNESLTNLRSTLKENGDALSIHTAKGQADREAVLASVQANIEQYNTLISSGMSAKDAAGQYDLNTTALEKQMHQAGLTQTQIDGLIGKYAKVPGKVPVVIAMTGLIEAINGLDETLKLINGLDGKTATVTIQTRRVGGVTGTGTDVPSVDGPAPRAAPKSPLKHPTQTPGARATGGVAGGLTWLGEQGAELARLPQGTTVYPHGQSMAMAAQQGGGPMAVNVQVTFHGSTDTAMAAAIQRMVRTGQIQLRAQIGGQSGRVTV